MHLRLTIVLWLATLSGGMSADYLTHAPMRPLPPVSTRPLVSEQTYFVNAERGADGNSGSEQQPWQSVQGAVKRLLPGDTLILRGGIYHEKIVIHCQGTADKPITIRSYPGELAILDGGLPEFQTDPASAWEPVLNGAPGEYRSTRSFPELNGRKDATGLLGNFADSMIPLHGCRFITDLRSTNEYLAALEGPKTAQGNGVYSGPGVFHDSATGRIHIRLAHTKQACLGTNNYVGESDPRRLRLVIAGSAGGSTLTVTNAAFVRLQDVVVRGSREATIDIESSLNITLDGVTSYGGSSALRVMNTTGLRAVNSAFRGIAAPWTWRGSLKYRAIEARIIAASQWAPTFPGNRDFEFAWCEFTDCVDGVFIGNVDGAKIHHSLLDNISDDGIFVTHRTAYDGTTPAGEIHVYQNLLSRCLTTFAFGVGHGRQKVLPDRVQTGPGVFIYRNVFDFRRPVHYQQPKEGESEIVTYGRTCGDHGGPAWEPMFIYHNTILTKDAPWRSYYADGFGMAMGKGTSRRIFNNIFVHYQGMPGEVLPSPQTDFAADGNLEWSASNGAADAASFLKRFRNGKDFAASRSSYAPGWTANDLYGDPMLSRVPEDYGMTVNVWPRADSPAINRGVPIPRDWPDPYRASDPDGADIGAAPATLKRWLVGNRGRISVLGETSYVSRYEFPNAPAKLVTGSANDKKYLPGGAPPAIAKTDATNIAGIPDRLTQTDHRIAPFLHGGWNGPTGAVVAIVEGYPAFDSPPVQYALAERGNCVAQFERRWLSVTEYPKYKVVIHVGNLRRAQADQFVFQDEELPLLRQWLEAGGTLLLMRSSHDIFGSDAGRVFQTELTGVPRTTRVTGALVPKLLQPNHEWLKTVVRSGIPSWLNVPAAAPLLTRQGTNVIGDERGRSILCEIPVGRGRVIYVGWDISRALPQGRLKTTAGQETIYEEQYRLLESIVRTVAKE